MNSSSIISSSFVLTIHGSIPRIYLCLVGVCQRRHRFSQAVQLSRIKSLFRVQRIHCIATASPRSFGSGCEIIRSWWGAALPEIEGVGCE